MAGGGGGGGGAGNDAATPLSIQYGNYNGYGSVSTSTININLPGDDAPDRTGQGGGPGGGGGGYDGSAGTLNTYSENSTTLQTTDLDSTGGNGGGAYYNATYATPLSAASPSGQGAGPGEEGAVYVKYSQQDVTPNSFSFSTYEWCYCSGNCSIRYCTDYWYYRYSSCYSKFSWFHSRRESLYKWC